MTPIITAVSSYGMSGQVFHGPFLKTNSSYEVNYVLERTKSLSKNDFPAATIVKNYDEMLSIEKIELVIVNTPTPMHYEMAKKALQAGKHVVVEKPMATTYKEAQDLITTAKSVGKQLAVYHNRRYASDFLTVQKLISEGRLSNIHTFETHFDRYRPGLNSKRWKETLEKGGGVFYDLSPHLIDQALVLFGEPETVWCKLFQHRPGSPSYDGFEIRLSYPTTEVRLRSGSLVLDLAPRFIIYGQTSSFVKTGADPQEEQLINKQLPTSSGYGVELTKDHGTLTTPEEATIIPSEVGDYGRFYRELAACLREDKPLGIKPEEGALVMKIIDLAVESHSQKQVIPFV